MEKAVAPHSSTLAWKIPWTEEPGRLQSMGWLRVGHDWVTSLSFFTFMNWRREWQPIPVLLPGESEGQGSLAGCHLMGLHRVGHDWSDLAAAAARRKKKNILPVRLWCVILIAELSKCGGGTACGNLAFIGLILHCLGYFMRQPQVTTWSLFQWFRNFVTTRHIQLG